MTDENITNDEFDTENSDISDAERLLGDDPSNADETIAAEPAVAPTTEEDEAEKP